MPTRLWRRAVLAELQLIRRAIKAQSVNTRRPTSSDKQLLRAIVGVIADDTFTAAELCAVAELENAGLRDAFKAAHVTSPRLLGKRLRQLRNIECGGLRVQRVSASSAGAIWNVERCED